MEKGTAQRGSVSLQRRLSHAKASSHRRFSAVSIATFHVWHSHHRTRRLAANACQWRRGSQLWRVCVCGGGCGEERARAWRAFAQAAFARAALNTLPDRQRFGVAGRNAAPRLQRSTYLRMSTLAQPSSLQICMSTTLSILGRLRWCTFLNTSRDVLVASRSCACAQACMRQSRKPRPDSARAYPAYAFRRVLSAAARTHASASCNFIITALVWR